ncbi:unnamed protein product [Closterium sp. Naga37s-1]|nr:unnamed protein product [Closterium sp. Naga37s-1]
MRCPTVPLSPSHAQCAAPPFLCLLALLSARASPLRVPLLCACLSSAHASPLCVPLLCAFLFSARVSPLRVTLPCACLSSARASPLPCSAARNAASHGCMLPPTACGGVDERPLVRAACRWMPWNYLDGSLSEYLKYFSALTNLNQLAMQYMFFSGTFPSLLTSLPSLTSLSLRFNYLTGSLPTSITKIKSLDIYQNYFVGSIPSGTWSYCDAGNNCLISVGNCQSNFQRSSCAICGSTDGTGTLCAVGQACVPSSDAKIAAAAAMLSIKAAIAAALLSIKSAMGLTYTTWAATNPCTLDGTTGKAGEWERCSLPVPLLCACLSSVRASPLRVPLLCARLSSARASPLRVPLLCACLSSARASRLPCSAAHNAASHGCMLPPTACGGVDQRPLVRAACRWMPWNYLDGSLSEYLKYFSALTNLNQLAMQYMFFSGTFPSLLTSLPSLTSLSLRFNYLTGSLPTSITEIKSLDINQNYFVGSVPSGTCGGHAEHQGSHGTHQIVLPSLFPVSCASAFPCLPSPTRPSAAALLSIKSAMGLTYTTWAATNPCTLDGTTGKAGEWERVSCTAFGRAYVINLDSAGLQRKSFPANISKLTGLGSVWMPWNYLDGNLAEYLKYFSALTNLNQLAMQYMFFSGTFPSLLTSLPSLTSLGASLPSRSQSHAPDMNTLAFCPSSVLRAHIHFPVRTYSLPGAHIFTSLRSHIHFPMRTHSIPYAHIFTSLCSHIHFPVRTHSLPCAHIFTSLCSHIHFPLLTYSLPCTISPSEPPFHSLSSSIRPLAAAMLSIKAAMAAALLSIKSAMGLTYTTWAATNPCTLDGTTGKAGEWERVSCTAFGRAYVIALCACLSSARASPLRVPLLCACLSSAHASPLRVPLLCACLSSVRASPLCVPLLCAFLSSAHASTLRVPLLCACVSSVCASPLPCSAARNAASHGCMLPPTACGGVDQRPLVRAACRWMPWNYLDGSLSEYLKYFSALTNLNQLAMQYMFFSGTFPSLLTSLPSLTSLSLRFNYLTGSLPTSITKFKSLDIYQNYFVGSIPSGTWSYSAALLSIKSAMGLTYTTWAATNPCTLDGTTGKAGEWESDSSARASPQTSPSSRGLARCKCSLRVPLLYVCLSSARASLRVPLLCTCLSSARASPRRVPLLCAFLSSVRSSPLHVPLLCACHSSARASPLRVPLLCACLSSARASPLRVPLLCAFLSSARASPLRVPLICAFLSSVRSSPLRVPLLCACLSSARASPLRVPLLCACLSSVRASPLRVPLLCVCLSSAHASPLRMPLLCLCLSLVRTSTLRVPLLCACLSSARASPLRVPLLCACLSSARASPLPCSAARNAAIHG